MPEQIATHAEASIDGILARLRARAQVRGVRCRGVRAVLVLEELGKGPMTTDELAGALRKPRADVEHVLAELQALGMVSSGRLIPGWAGSLIVHRLTEARA